MKGIYVMLRKSIGAMLLLIFLSIPCFAEVMLVNKIVLGRFNAKTDIDIVLAKSDPYWPDINRHNISIDAAGNIYILNISSKEIIVFNNSGLKTKKIRIPMSSIIRKRYEAGELQASGNGEKFLVEIPSSGRYASDPGYIKGRKFILGADGQIIKEFLDKIHFDPFPDFRLCTNNTYLNYQTSVLYDENFKRLEETFKDYSDSDGIYELKNRENKIIKRSKSNGKMILWERQFINAWEIVGIDGNNNIYINGILGKGDKYSLYKLNSKGEILAQAPIPDPYPFLTKEEQEVWDAHSSEELLSVFKLACNGDVYLIYQLSELPSATFKRWLKGGEYFIFKFETKK